MQIHIGPSMGPFVFDLKISLSWRWRGAQCEYCPWITIDPCRCSFPGIWPEINYQWATLLGDVFKNSRAVVSHLMHSLQTVYPIFSNRPLPPLITTIVFPQCLDHQEQHVFILRSDSQFINKAVCFSANSRQDATSAMDQVPSHALSPSPWGK
jgi:hypothetical protein